MACVCSSVRRLERGQGQWTLDSLCEETPLLVSAKASLGRTIELRRVRYQVEQCLHEQSFLFLPLCILELTTTSLAARGPCASFPAMNGWSKDLEQSEWRRIGAVNVFLPVLAFLEGYSGPRLDV